MDIRILIKFHVVLGKSTLECYMSLRECLGTYTPSYQAVHRWMNAIKNGWEETDDDSHSRAPTSAMDEYGKSGICPWMYAQQLLQMSELL